MRLDRRVGRREAELLEDVHSGLDNVQDAEGAGQDVKVGAVKELRGAFSEQGGERGGVSKWIGICIFKKSPAEGPAGPGPNHVRKPKKMALILLRA